MLMEKKSTKLVDQLRKAIAGSGRTLSVMSQETGVSKSTLSRFVRGERGLLMDALDAIGECLSLRIMVGKSREK